MPVEGNESVSVAHLEDDWKERHRHAETLASELRRARESLREVARCLDMFYIYMVYDLDPSAVHTSGLKRR